MLKLQSHDVMSERTPFAMTAMLFMACAEAFLRFLLRLVSFSGMPLPNRAFVFGTLGALLMTNYHPFVNGRRYVGIVRQYARQRRHLRFLAMAIRDPIVGSFLAAEFVILLRMP